jgi:hypothetical protein
MDSKDILLESDILQYMRQFGNIFDPTFVTNFRNSHVLAINYIGHFVSIFKVKINSYSDNNNNCAKDESIHFENLLNISILLFKRLLKVIPFRRFEYETDRNNNYIYINFG